MYTDAELRELKQTVDRISATLDEVDDVVRGDTGRNISGLLKDMEIVEDFIDKWEKREYMVRGAFFLLSSNIVLTLLAIGASFLGG